jgi:hypothetical protein
MSAAMQVLVSSVVLVLAIVVAAVPSPAPTPFPIGTLVPFGTTPAPLSTLPNIGRVRSAAPACTAMHDLIIPSFAAARIADARFAQTQVRLPQYADLVDDPLHRADIYRESALSRLDQDADALLNQALVLNRALGDPRLSPKSTDPDVIAERKALEELYDAEKTRANLLTEFVTRQRVAIAKAGIDTSTKDFSKPQAPPTDQVQPIPILTAPPGMPLLVGMNMSDKKQITQWGADLTANVAYNENQAAKTFLPIARACTK